MLKKKKIFLSFDIIQIFDSSYFFSLFQLVDLAVPFTEMSWQLHDNDIDEDKLPSLFIQFLAKDEGENVTKLLEIHSKQVIDFYRTFFFFYCVVHLSSHFIYSPYRKLSIGLTSLLPG